MSLVDSILNIAALLVWLNWRLAPVASPPATRPLTLLGTLKRTEPRRWSAILMVAALPFLLVFRALVYHQIGMEVDWTPSLQFGGLPVMFRSDVFERILVYSFLSFLLTMVTFYTCLLLLSVLNRHPAAADPIGHLVSGSLGSVGRRPAWIQLALPVVGGALGWIPLSLLLARSGLLPVSPVWPHRVLEGLLVGIDLCLVWNYVVAVLLVLHMLHHHVHLGPQPVWEYADGLARNFLRPFKRMPLRLRNVDFTPLAVMAGVFLLANRLEWLLDWLYLQLPM